MKLELSRTTRFYRALLRLLPFDFRSDFGSEMEQVFAEQRAEAARDAGRMGVWRLRWETDQTRKSHGVSFIIFMMCPSIERTEAQGNERE